MKGKQNRMLNQLLTLKLVADQISCRKTVILTKYAKKFPYFSFIQNAYGTSSAADPLPTGWEERQDANGMGSSDCSVFLELSIIMNVLKL